MSLHDEIMSLAKGYEDGDEYGEGYNDGLIDAARLAAKADAEIERLKAGFNRYEKLRRLNVRQFAELYKKNLLSGIALDTLVDELN